MKTIFIIIAMIALSISCTSGQHRLDKRQQAYSSSVKFECSPPSLPIDFSGIVAFIMVASYLRHDQEPPKQVWQELESTPGYSVLLESEFSDQGFREPFRLALMPSKKENLQKALEEGTCRYLDHYAGWTKESMDRFPSLVRQLAKGYDPCEISIRSAQYLPPMEELKPPEVSVVIFSPDARGYDPIVLDLSVVEMFPGQKLNLLLGHEFHHYFRNKLKIASRYQPNDIEKEIVWALDQLQAEGIADHINVPDMLNQKMEHPMMVFVQKKYRTLLDKADKSLEAFDEIVRSIARGEKMDKDTIKKRIRDALPMACHPAGFSMARTIMSVHGIEKIKENVANPFAFLINYQQAAIAKQNQQVTSGPYCFSEDTIQWLSDLERRIERARLIGAAQRQE